MFERHFAQFQLEMTENENNELNKDLLLMRNKIYTFVRGYDRYTAKLKRKIEKLEAENLELKLWRMKHNKCLEECD